MTDPTRQAITLGVLVFLIGAIGGTCTGLVYFWLNTRLRRRELRVIERIERQQSKAVHPASPAIPPQRHPVVVPFEPRYPAPPEAASFPLGRFDHPTDERRPVTRRRGETVVDVRMLPDYR